MNKKDYDDLKSTVLSFLSEIKKSNQDFIDKANQRIEVTEKTVKCAPANLEDEILRVAQKSITESVKSVLTSYNSPLNKLVESVVNENSTFLRQVISDSFNEVIRKDEFKAAIVSAFSHKVARSIISNNEGLFDKVSNELKQDSQFKAKITLAVANVVEECLKN